MIENNSLLSRMIYALFIPWCGTFLEQCPTFLLRSSDSSHSGSQPRQQQASVYCFGSSWMNQQSLVVHELFDLFLKNVQY